jgi:hypothetical protein
MVETNSSVRAPLRWAHWKTDSGVIETWVNPHFQIIKDSAKDEYEVYWNALQRVVKSCPSLEEAQGFCQRLLDVIDGYDVARDIVDALEAKVERLRSYEPCDPCKRGDHDDCTGNCMSMCCALNASERENERLLSAMQWMVSRKKLERQHVKDRCWGLSSDSLVLNVFDTSFALHEPSNPSDLMACVRTVAMAPEHLVGPLRIILDRWINVVCGKYPDLAGEIAQAISDMLSFDVGGTVTATGQESQTRGTDQA